MKSLEELKKEGRLLIGHTSIDGGSGEVHMPSWKGSVIWSFDGGWEHVSVAPRQRRITPSWDDMCRLKDMFFHEDEYAIEFHPAKSEYANNLPNCLHLWRYTEGEMPVPNSLMVGLKKGQGIADIRAYRDSLMKG